MNFRPILASIVFMVSATAMADVSEEQNFSYSLNSNGRISLENINGNVTITGGSGDQVEITAVKKADNQEYLDGIEILIDASDDAILIDTRHPDSGASGWFNWGKSGSGSVTYTLSVPSSANLENIESINGNVEISGVSGVVKAETVNGGIEASDLASNAKLETVNGAVYASFSSLTGQQRVNAETVNGKLSIRLPANADASVSAETVNGGIDGSDFGLVTSKGFIGRDLEGKIGDGSARVSLSTVNGSIKIRSN